MSWLNLTLNTTAAHIENIETALYAAGAVSISLVSDQDEPVLEPEPGATPVWQHLKIVALLPLDTDLPDLKRGLSGFEATDLLVDFVGEEDWQAKVNNAAVELTFGERLRLRPKARKTADSAANPASDEPVTLFLEPGLAFGSGSHPTTHMCLTWIAEHVVAGQHVMDFGCGSGVLGIAAGLLGATVTCVDYDPQAVMATLENAAYNGLSTCEGEVSEENGTLSVLSLEAWDEYLEQPAIHSGKFDVLVANILAGPIQQLAPMFEQIVCPGGAIVLSGILEAQGTAVMDSFECTGFQTTTEAEWVCLSGERATG